MLRCDALKQWETTTKKRRGRRQGQKKPSCSSFLRGWISEELARNISRDGKDGRRHADPV